MSLLLWCLKWEKRQILLGSQTSAEAVDSDQFGVSRSKTQNERESKTTNIDIL